MTLPRGNDRRVTFGLISDLFILLREHGYRPPSSSAVRRASFGRVLDCLMKLTAAYEGQTVAEFIPGAVTGESALALEDMPPEVAEVFDLVSRINRAAAIGDPAWTN